MKTHTVTEVLGKDLKLNDIIWWNSGWIDIALNTELTSVKIQCGEKGKVIVRTLSSPDKDKVVEALKEMVELITGRYAWAGTEIEKCLEKAEAVLSSLHKNK